MPLGEYSVPAEGSHNVVAKPYPGFLQAVSLLILYGIITFCLMIPIIILAIVSDIPIHKEPLFRIIVSFGALISVLWFGIEKSKKEFGQLFSFKPIQVSLLIPFMLTLIGLRIVSSEVNSLVVAVIPGGEAAAQSILEFFQKDTYVFIVSAILVGPFVEELIFRGLILQGFLRRYTVRKAIVVSALLFAVFHGNVFQFTPALTAGLVFGWWYVKTGSLVSCIFGHAINNALIAFAASFVGAYFPQYEGPQFNPLWVDIVGVILLILGIWLSVRLFSKGSA
jgi:membrane protease YdiL (CAAX protease family)